MAVSLGWKPLRTIRCEDTTIFVWRQDSGDRLRGGWGEAEPINERKSCDVKSFAEILKAADKLSLEEQEALIDLLSRRAADRKRDLLCRDVRKARKEFKEGRVRPSTPDDILIGTHQEVY